MNLRAMALERKVKRLKNDLSGAKQIINTLNLRLSDAEEENEQLKKSVKRQQSSNNECEKLIKEQQKENEQLKKQLKDYHNAFDCSQCRYQNYDWFDDGDEFEVCDKGNNEAQMNNHSCKDWEEL